MESVVAQLPALIGVLIGAIGTIVATSVADRTRWKRNQSVRWDDRRLDAYVEFGRVVKEIHAIAVRMLASDRPQSRGHRMDREEGLARLAEADVRRTLAWESVLLLGDASTVSAARDWRDAVWGIERVARGSPRQTTTPTCCTGPTRRETSSTVRPVVASVFVAVRSPRPRCSKPGGMRSGLTERHGGQRRRRPRPRLRRPEAARRDRSRQG